MGETSSTPAMIIDEAATDAQRQSLLDFETLARQAESGLIEAALELQARASNLMPLVERVTRMEVMRIYSTWEQIRNNRAYTALVGFDEETEALIEHDPEYNALMQARSAVIQQRGQAASLVRQHRTSKLVDNLKEDEQTLHEAINRRRFEIFAGRIATDATVQETPGVSDPAQIKSPA